MMGTPWNLPMLFAPSAARSTNASTVGQTPSLSSQTPSSPQTVPPLPPPTLASSRRIVAVGEASMPRWIVDRSTTKPYRSF